jgi:hypothetical protein
MNALRCRLFARKRKTIESRIWMHMSMSTQREIVVSGLHEYERASAVAQGKGVFKAHHIARAALTAAEMTWSRTRQATSVGVKARL